MLITAFEPYAEWPLNASALAVEALDRSALRALEIHIRLYPVDYDAVRERLCADLSRGYDWALHLGQAPGRARIELEAVAHNLCSDDEAGEGSTRVLQVGGSESLRTRAPIEAWARQLCGAGIPAAVSRDAGRFLCNAAFYWSLLQCRTLGASTQSAFLHVPLAPQQVTPDGEPLPCMESERVALALSWILERLG